MLKLSDVYIRPSSPADSANWDDYVDNSKIRTYAHRWGWSEILEKSFGITPYYYVAESDGKIVGILPTALMQSRLFGTFLISLPWLDYGGALADNDEIAAKLIDVAIESARSKGCRFFEMRAVRHRLPNLTEKTDKREFLLELREGEETVWKSFDAKARNQVRKAEKAGLSVEFGKLDKFNDFYTVFSYNMRDLGTPVWPKNLFKEIFNTFPDDTEFAVVKKNDEIIAAGLLIHYKDYSGVPSASAYRKYLKLCPNNLLYWEVIKRCISRGSSFFDFGRSSEGAGTYRFKKQWMKKPKEQIWQYKLLKIDELPELNPNNPKFKLAINIWRRLPLPIANFLGPKIITKLP